MSKLPECMHRNWMYCLELPNYRRSGKCKTVLYSGKCPHGKKYPFTIKHNSIKYKVKPGHHHNLLYPNGCVLCGKKNYANGFCRQHFSRWYKYLKKYKTAIKMKKRLPRLNGKNKFH